MSNDICKVSVPSVVESAVIFKVIESVVPTTKFPVRLALSISALATPEIVYGNVVPSATAVVARDIVTEPPSLTVE